MRLLPWCFALLLLLPQCGGSAPAASAGDAKSEHGERGEGEDEREASSPSEDEGETDGAATEKSKVATCDDRTCSTCGSNICPTGWYCDEKASACSWLPQCVEKPTCGCVTRVLGAGCKCTEESGALKVACD